VHSRKCLLRTNKKDFILRIVSVVHTARSWYVHCCIKSLKANIFYIRAKLTMRCFAEMLILTPTVAKIQFVCFHMFEAQGSA